MEVRNFVVPLHSQSGSNEALESNQNGALVQLVRIRACHARGQGFESPTHRRKTSKDAAKSCKQFVYKTFCFFLPHRIIQQPNALCGVVFGVLFICLRKYTELALNSLHSIIFHLDAIRL